MENTAGEVGLFGEGELAPVAEKVCVEALRIYNEAAKGTGWPEARFLTQSRRTALRRAVKDYGGLVGLKTHLAAAAQNDFLTGQTDRGERHRNWRPDIDWFLRPANVLKVLEGKWPANTGPAAAAVAAGTPDPHLEDRAKLRRYRKGGWWPAGWGPRPEEAGCRLHADVLREWRELNKVVVQAPESRRESREERVAASIAAWRKIGNHTRADALEVELAELRGESLVTLPPRPGAAGTRSGAGTRKGEPMDVTYDDAFPEGEDFGDE